MAPDRLTELHRQDATQVFTVTGALETGDEVIVNLGGRHGKRPQVCIQRFQCADQRVCNVADVEWRRIRGDGSLRGGSRTAAAIRFTTTRLQQNMVAVFALHQICRPAASGSFNFNTTGSDVTIANTAGTANSQQCTKPANLAVGDLILVCGATRGGESLDTPVGYNLIDHIALTGVERRRHAHVVLEDR